MRPLALALLALGAVAPALHAQTPPPPPAIERNEPPALPRPSGPALQLDPQSLEPGSTDATPLGATVAGIRLLGPAEGANLAPAAGVQIGDIGDGDRAVIRQALAPFVGKPLSRKLISDAQAAVAKVYRDSGHPFVSVTLPPHDATNGTLQLRVVEFRLGKVQVNGDPASPLESDLRLTNGERIDAKKLSEDLDWLNRNPYRQVQGAFAAGDELGTSNLELSITETKPWQVFAGYSNTGTRSTGKDRYFLGGAGVIKPLNNTLISYQLTGDTDFWSKPGSITLGDDRPRYLSHSGRVTIPLAARQALEIAPNFVAQTTESSQLGGLFVFRTESDTFEIPVVYRTAVSNLFDGYYLGDLTFGVEFKRSKQEQFLSLAGSSFIPLGKSEADVWQFVAGWAHQIPDKLGSTSFDIKLKANPGADEDEWELRGRDAKYVYASLDLTRVTRLPGRLTWVAQFTGTLSTADLPDTEQIAPGGFYATRGYQTDDGSADRGFVLRNELRLPSVALFPGRDQLSPYFFLDFGYGESDGSPDVKLASAGAGLDYRYGKTLSVGAAVGVAMRDANKNRTDLTEKNDATFHFRASLSF
ncbi:MAG: ShlB/FhaC/HecB family hemolysin secretion/activation protein [Opitutaceae bacterium]|nr:ShlB/FhaC/HecB family hemolysin secretion/activation protein [Opitutaceae bacterium]